MGKEKEITLFYGLALLAVLVTATVYYPEGVEESPGFALELTGYVILAAALFIVLMRFAPHILRVLLAAADVLIVFFATSVFLLPFTDAWVWWGVLAALARVIFRRSKWIQNTLTAVSAGTIGGLVGVAVSPAVAMFLIVLLSVYDFIAVFISRHMVKMAEFLVGRHVKTSEERALGTGDIVLPGVLVGSLAQYDERLALVSAVGALAGLLFTMFLIKRYRRPLPALPSISSVMLAFLLAGVVVLNG